MFPKRLLALTLFAALAVMPPCVLRAQWVQTNGLYEGVVMSIAGNGEDLFANIGGFNTGVGTSVYRSTNSGVSWSEANKGLPPDDTTGFSGITGLLSIGNRVFLANSNYSPTTIYLWSDARSRWIEAGTFSQEVNNNTFGAFGKFLLVGAVGGIARSSDEGSSWTFVDSASNQPSFECSVTSFASIDTLLFAGTSGVRSWGQGIFRSSDSGNHWIRIDLADSGNIWSLVAIGNKLFAATDSGVRFSTDFGISWNGLNNGLPSGVGVLAALGNTLIAGTDGGIYIISTDTGSHWTAPLGGVSQIRIYTLAVSGDTLFAGTNGNGFFLSTDTGRSWSSANAGLTPVTPSVLLGSGSTLYAYGGSLFRSTDSGMDWHTTSSLVTTSSYLTSLAEQGTNLYASSQAGVFVSTDSGITSIQVNNGLSNDDVVCLAVEGSNLFAGTVDSGIFVTTDSGANWSDASGGLPSGVQISCMLVLGYHIIAGTVGGYGVFVTSDNGQDWSSANDGLVNVEIRGIENLGPYVFILTDSGIFRSTIANGLSWTAIAQPSNGPYEGLSKIAASGKTLFEATYPAYENRHIYASFDYGEHWFVEDSGLANVLANGYLTVLTVYDSMLFAGLETYGSSTTLWRRSLSDMPILSYILGANVDTVNFGTIPADKDGLQLVTVTNVGNVALTISSFQLTPSQDVFSTSDLSAEVDLNPGESFTFEVFFMPTQSGEFSANINIISEAKAINIVLVGSAGRVDGVEQPSLLNSMLTIAPNPFSQSTQITFTSPSAGYAEVSIVNMLGVEVARLFSGELGAGEHSFMWGNPTGLPDGVYECLVRMNGQVQTLPVVLMR